MLVSTSTSSSRKERGYCAADASINTSTMTRADIHSSARSLAVNVMDSTGFISKTIPSHAIQYNMDYKVLFLTFSYKLQMCFLAIILEFMTHLSMCDDGGLLMA